MSIRAIAASGAIAVIVCTAFGVAAKTQVPVQPAQSYRFVIKGPKAIRGLITVDGKDRLVEHADTPFEFRCEAGSVISGYFEAIDAGRTIKLEVFDPVVSKKKSAVRYAMADHVRFSWAQVGVGPRCVDQGDGACPDSTPSIEDFKRRLAALQRAG